MSQPCPLCGKAKSDDTLFCNDCERRIRTDYEVNVPESETTTHTESPQTVEFITEPRDKISEPRDKRELEEARDPRMVKPLKSLLLIVLFLLMLGGGYMIYNELVRKRNLERSGWETAMKLNSVGGYIAYIEAFPNGAHISEAQEGLYRLKSEEASTWETMKTSANSSILRDFLNQHPESPYTPLVRKRLDSLTWIGALRVNTPQSYADYLMQAEQGDFSGDYSAEARKRQEMLRQLMPVENDVLEGIQSTIGGFFTSLSGSNHAGAYQYLAPVVQRFFNSGAATRERITGELLMTRTRAQGHTLSFAPNLEAFRYERMTNGNYRVNIPLTKSYHAEGSIEQVPGYIAHIELNAEFEITSIYETKPHPDAP